MLESLEFHVGVEMRVLVVQVHRKAHIDLVAVQVIDERSATCIAAQRPAHRVGHTALFVLGGVDLPELFHADAVFLRLAVLGKIVFRDRPFRERSAHAFAEEDIFAQKLHARLVARPWRAIGVFAKLARDHAFDLAAIAVNELGTGHAGEDLDP